ncbi:MAG TPA: hypothetical protein H9675_03210 [Firmicutes bacterium]|nr:hypothetical protein [Bacillota bacterium]
MANKGYSLHQWNIPLFIIQPFPFINLGPSSALDEDIPLSYHRQDLFLLAVIKQ